MSRTYELVCRETRQKLWVGQGREEMDNLYSTPNALELLRGFLVATKGKALVLMCTDTEDGDWGDYEDFDADADD